jgi:hypothetical protein
MVYIQRLLPHEGTFAGLVHPDDKLRHCSDIIVPFAIRLQLFHAKVSLDIEFISIKCICFRWQCLPNLFDEELENSLFS